jgi:hypothetical protein
MQLHEEISSWESLDRSSVLFFQSGGWWDILLSGHEAGGGV